MILGLPLLVSAAATQPARAQISVPHVDTQTYINTIQVTSYLIDLESLPDRPILSIETIPSSADPNFVTSIEITGFSANFASGPGACPGPGTTIASNLDPGPKTMTWSPISCDPRPEHLVGETIEVRVRVASFGSAGAPAAIKTVFRAETSVPTATHLIPYAPTFAQQSATAYARKDTTIYARAGEGSNGLGDSLWVGADSVLVSPPLNYASYPIRSLLSFALEGAVPQSALVDDAEIVLNVQSLLGTTNILDIRRAPTSSSMVLLPWLEGDAHAPGNEFTAGFSTITASTWLYRRFTAGPFASIPWAAPGAAPLSPSLANQSISTVGSHTFSTPALTQAVQDMVSDGEASEGFLMTGTETFSFADRGVQITSSNAPSSGRPRMVVYFTPTEPYQADTVATGSVNFIGEGENLRWIYDLDNDDVVETDIGGICSITSTNNGGTQLPYSYQYTGSPGYTGLDCCTWHLDSPETGTLGTGQAIFFHNLDPNIPGNLPPDSDADGIRDNCDNCVMVPNGPLLGTCTSGSAVGTICRSDLECAGNGACSLSQEDANGDYEGDACVPEPGFAWMLGSGILALSASRRLPRRLAPTARRSSKKRA